MCIHIYICIYECNKSPIPFISIDKKGSCKPQCPTHKAHWKASGKGSRQGKRCSPLFFFVFCFGALQSSLLGLNVCEVMIEKENSCHLQISGAAAPGVRDQSVLFLLLFSEWVSEDSSFVVLLWWWQWRWRWLFLFFLLIQKFSRQSTVPHSQQPTLSPGLSSTLFFPKNKVEDANDETEAKADPGQYEAVAVVRTYQCYLAHRLTVCEPSCVNGDSNQNAQPCRKEGKRENWKMHRDQHHCRTSEVIFWIEIVMHVLCHLREGLQPIRLISK